MSEQLEHWDLIVVGAGPAGASAALGALRDHPSMRVLLVDREDFPRDKSCGDGVAPHVFDALAEVGVLDVADRWKPLHRLDLHHGERRVEGRLRSTVSPWWVSQVAELPARPFDVPAADPELLPPAARPARE